MVKAIFYKEWIKCRALLTLLMTISVALVAYLFINNANLLRTDGVVAVWAQIAEGGFTIFPSYIIWFMPLAALSIAVMQYSMEMSHKRFKLTLHLPYSEGCVVSAMQIFGVVMALILYAIILIPCYFGLRVYYAPELVNLMFVSLIPYILCGVACYFFAMWVIIEPIWRRRVGYLVVALIALMPFVIGGMLGSAIYLTPSLLLIVAVSIVTSYYSASRFKDGAQN